jgi:hypothetical protein
MRGRQDDRRDQGDGRSRRRARLRLALYLTALVTSGSARAATPDCADVALYARILQVHTRAVDDVVGTRVDYSGLRADPAWQDVVRSVGACDPAVLSTREATLAFWINAYNVFAIDLVAKHWPVESIKDIGSLLFPVWDKPAGRVNGVALSLDQIEHERIRKLGDPRIHAAIVCASISCPSLSRSPYVAAELDAQLDAAFARFVADPTKGFRLDRAANTIHLSSIFKWFAEDFEKQGGPLAVIARHLGESDRAWVEANAAKARLEYMDYDWRVNG